MICRDLDPSTYSAKEIMDVFKSNPDKIFPFKAEGPGAFADGKAFRLVDATNELGVWDDSANVAVATNETPV